MKIWFLMVFQFISSWSFSQIIQFRYYFKDGSFETSKFGFKENATLQIDTLLGEMDLGSDIDNYFGVLQNQSSDTNFICLRDWRNNNEIYFSSTFKSINNFRSFKDSNEVFFESILLNLDSIDFLTIGLENTVKSLNENLDYIHFQYENCKVSSIILFSNLSDIFHELIVPVFDQNGKKLTSINTKFKDHFISNIDNIFGESKHSIYPNPTDGHLNINGFNKCEVKIYDMLGNKVYDFFVIDNKVDISFLKEGLYTLTTKPGQNFRIFKR